MTTDSELRLYAEYQVRGYDSSGNLLQSDNVEQTGMLTVNDVKMNGLDKLEIDLLAVELRDGETTIQRIEADLEHPDTERIMDLET